MVKGPPTASLVLMYLSPLSLPWPTQAQTNSALGVNLYITLRTLTLTSF